jgi:alpha-glucosidase
MAQPDLNWRNPAVEKAMFDSMRFWLDRGVAGFRLDAIDTIYEDPQLRNEPLTGGKNVYGDPQTHTIYTGYLPEVFDLVKRMRELVDSYPGDRILIGETNGNAARLNQWYGGPNHDRLQLPMDQMIGMHSQLKPELVRQDLNEVEDEVYGSQPLLVFDNHDQKRSWDRLGDGIHNDQIARAVAMILFTTRSTAMLYEGQEIGMTDHTPARVEDVRDPIGVTGWPKEKGRDGERTPMQWTPGPQAGFSTNPQTWLPVGSDYKTINVQTESGEQGSLLAWYKQLIRMRRTIPALGT